ncbi:hypothetical protein [uncultured Jatrophihabitans sp.]|uniref:hypothetical protein n=1 Tax=uncultured Jatrophihabitans sp. TaxID=1610747 RepID=UPI0035CC1767
MTGRLAPIAALILALGFVSFWLASAATGATTPPYPPTAPCPAHATCVGVGGAPAPTYAIMPGAPAPAPAPTPGPGAATRAGHGHGRTPGHSTSGPRRTAASSNAPTSAAPGTPRNAAQQPMLEFGGVHFPLWWIAVIAGVIVVAGTLLIFAVVTRRR